MTEAMPFPKNETRYCLMIPHQKRGLFPAFLVVCTRKYPLTGPEESVKILICVIACLGIIARIFEERRKINAYF